jgi:hypothetical protein
MALTRADYEKSRREMWEQTKRDTARIVALETAVRRLLAVEARCGIIAEAGMALPSEEAAYLAEIDAAMAALLGLVGPVEPVSLDDVLRAAEGREGSK